MNNPQLVTMMALCVAGECVSSRTTNDFASSPPDIRPLAVIELPISDFVVLTPDAARYSWGFRYPKSSLWKPTDEQTVDALRKLPAHLENALQRKSISTSYFDRLPGVIERLPQTLCQSVGIVADDREAIFLNFIPRDSDYVESDFLRDNYVTMVDGSPRWWSIIHDPGEEEFAQLHIDLGF